MPTTNVRPRTTQRCLSEDCRPAPAADGHAVDELRELMIHDIRSPLTAIRGYTQLLRRRAASNRLEIAALLDSLQRIEAAATRIEGLLDELGRPPASADKHGAAFPRQPTDLVQLAQCVAAVSEAAGMSRCHVVVLSAVPELVGWWDASHVERALANLIDNAVKYNREDRPVAVTVQRTDAEALISVADQGVGIPAAELTRVCERGYRASNVASHFHGAGLGLAGVHDVVAEHGGALDLESQIGVGTTVTLRLPRGAPIPCT